MPFEPFSTSTAISFPKGLLMWAGSKRSSRAQIAICRSSFRRSVEIFLIRYGRRSNASIPKSGKSKILLLNPTCHGGCRRCPALGHWPISSRPELRVRRLPLFHSRFRSDQGAKTTPRYCPSDHQSPDCIRRAFEARRKFQEIYPCTVSSRLCLGRACCAPSLGAQTVSPNHVLTLAEALSLARTNAPTLDAADAGVRVADAARRGVELRPNPVVNTDIENVGGPAAYDVIEARPTSLLPKTPRRMSLPGAVSGWSTLLAVSVTGARSLALARFWRPPATPASACRSLSLPVRGSVPSGCRGWRGRFRLIRGSDPGLAGEVSLSRWLPTPASVFGAACTRYRPESSPRHRSQVMPTTRRPRPGGDPKTRGRPARSR